MIIFPRDWEAPFSQRQCVSPVIACGQSRGDLYGIAVTQAKRFTWSVAGATIGSSFSIRRFAWRHVASSVDQVPYALLLSRQHMPRNFHYKRKWREMDRLATRIYCKVAAFEREHALGHEKKERRSSSWFVQTKETSDAKRYACYVVVCTSHSFFDGRHIELFLCTTLYREIYIFFFRRPTHRRCQMKEFEIRFSIDLITLWSRSSRAFMNRILPSTGISSDQIIIRISWSIKYATTYIYRD